MKSSLTPQRSKPALRKRAAKEEPIVRATVVGERGQVVIPKEIRDRAGLNPGSRLMVIQHQAHDPIMLVPMEHMRDFMTQIAKQMKGVDGL